MTYSDLIGRDPTLDRLEQLLRSERLVTLLGAPGIGKTRVALELARRASPHLGVRICDAAELAAGRVPPPAAADRWLIVDSAELAPSAVAETLARWLRAAPELHCLAVSRDRLQLASEVVFELEPLTEEQGLQLFVDRAARARDGFVLAADERAIVAAIARQLDGIPLAIELAAEQMVVLRPAELLARLDQRLMLLTSSRRDAPARHASLRASIAWSWERLEPAEREVLAQCAVFRGGFSLEAAETIVVSPSATEPLVNVLRRLCDRSLVRGRSPGSADAFRVLSNVAAYAREQLAVHPDAAALAARHADYYFEQAVRAPVHALRRTGCPATLEDNLLALAERGVHADGALRVGLERALDALAWLADVTADADGLAARLDTALEAARAQPCDLHAHGRAKLARARLRLQLGAAAAALPELAHLAETAAEPKLRADAAFALALAERRCGHHVAAEQAYQRALAAAIELGDTPGEARILTNLASLAAERGELQEAHALHERALALYRALGDEAGAAVVLQNAGLILQELGRLAEAGASFEEALAQHRAFGHKRFEAIAHLDLAGLALERGLPEAARLHAATADQQLRAAGELRLAALAQAISGACEASLGRIEPARVALSRADAALAAQADRVFAGIVAVQRGHLELALARRAYALGDDARWTEHVATARALATRSGAADTRVECDELRLAERVLHAAVARHDRLADALCVASDHGWVRGPRAARVELGTKKTLRLLLAALLRRRLGADGPPLSAAELIRAGWPEQRAAGSAAMNRLQVALSQLRRVGLEGVLVREAKGYVLDPHVDVLLVEHDS